MAATYEPIATYTVGTAVASYTVSSIPATYTDLKVVIYAHSSLSPSQDSLWSIKFNGDTGNNYSTVLMRGDGTTVSCLSQTSTVPARIGFALTDGAGANFYGSIILDIFSYAGSTHKTYLSTGAANFGSGGYVSRIVGLWSSTSAITSFTLTDNNAANISVGTIVTLYGIKAA